jgi:MoaA/NifB/PqqE/SkfB family radical SAM enzyme
MLKGMLFKLINRTRVLKKYEFPGVKGIGLQLYLTDHCNYGCRGCLAFSPLAKEGYAKLEIIERDLQRMAFLTNNSVDAINLLGGEPLLHPQVTVFFGIARKYFPETEIRLVTNGILLPRQGREFWKAMKKNNIILRPTKMPALYLPWKEIEKKARRYKVPFKYYGIDYAPEGEEIPKTLEHFVLDLAGNQVPGGGGDRCPHTKQHLYSLIDGKIFPCCITAGIRHFNAYFNKNLEISNADYIDLFDVTNVNEIFSFLEKPLAFCRYCNLEKITWGEFGLTKKEIGEWT